MKANIRTLTAHKQAKNVSPFCLFPPVQLSYLNIYTCLHLDVRGSVLESGELANITVQEGFPIRLSCTVKVKYLDLQRPEIFGTCRDLKYLGLAET